ncbi:Helicase SKI2W [Fasciola gigantica]|uniref:Helicase SKI2W n=1 Tax=Fasciola gigantica TaxID=46835 RepID=A0A504Y929_FASGI|nr:Helicase SKI2W [Fasciola gigantica]
MARHRQERAASEAGLQLVVGSNTAAADDLLPQLVDESNRGLYTLVRQVVALSSRNVGKDEDRTVVHGLPADFPISVQLGRVLRAKTNATESNDLFGELWLLGEELTTPLLGASVTQRLAPMTCPDVRAHLAQFHRTCRRRWAVKRLETSLSNDKLSLNSEYLGRLRVLEELGFIDTANEKGCLSLKGLVACELQQMEVLLTQLLLDGSFTQLPAVDIAALMSCFVFELRASDLAREEQRAAQTNPTAEEPQAHVMVHLAEKLILQ